MMLQAFLNIMYTANFVEIVTYNHNSDSTVYKFSYQFLGDRFLQVPPRERFPIRSFSSALSPVTAFTCLGRSRKTIQ